MSLKKAKARDRKRRKQRGMDMKVSGKSLFLIQRVQRERAERIKEKKGLDKEE
jgi:hypothetical protein